MKIALIAHDKKKNEIIELAKEYKETLANYELYATGTTGTLIMGETARPIHRMKSGPLGGDQQIGAMLANGELGLIIFLRDPLTAQPHEPDVSALLRLCDVQKIPLATNASSVNSAHLSFILFLLIFSVVKYKAMIVTIMPIILKTDKDSLYATADTIIGTTMLVVEIIAVKDIGPHEKAQT